VNPIYYINSNEKPYKTEKLSGKVEFHWGGDWYADTAEIRYNPITVNSSQFKIIYSFKEI